MNLLKRLFCLIAKCSKDTYSSNSAELSLALIAISTRVGPWKIHVAIVNPYAFWLIMIMIETDVYPSCSNRTYFSSSSFLKLKILQDGNNDRSGCLGPASSLLDRFTSTSTNSVYLLFTIVIITEFSLKSKFLRLLYCSEPHGPHNPPQFQLQILF